MGMRGLWIALGFLTRLPVPRVAATADDFARAVRLYPLAGLAVGAVVAAAGWLGAQADSWVGAVAALSAWVWVTGALHLDGLGDLADGLGAAHGDRGRMLTAMADPHTGSFGVVAIGLLIAAKLVFLHLVLPGDWPLLVAIPAAARLGPLVWARVLPPLRAEGLGAAIAGAVRTRDLLGWSGLLLGISALYPALAIAFVLIASFGMWVRQRVGGVSGDIHGAGIEVTEACLLLFAAIVID